MAAADAAASRPGRYHRTWIMLALVLVVAGAALLVMDRRVPATDGPAPPDTPGAPDVFIEGAQVSQFRADGRLEYRLDAAEIRHFQGSPRTLLVEPRLALHDDDGAPWRASASSGVIRRPGGGEETVILRGNVVLEQLRSAGEPLRLTTPFLRLYPERQYAETDRNVIIRGDTGRTTAMGLEGDLQAGTLRLFSAGDDPVHTTLIPEQFK